LGELQIWNKCVSGIWCQLNNVNLAHDHFTDMEGVYIIWHGSDNPENIIKVGQGNIAERLYSHRNDPEIQGYNYKTLYVTWAKLMPIYHDGVEAYLGLVLKPLIAERFPSTDLIKVNLPWLL